MFESSSNTGDRGYQAFIESKNVPDSVTWTHVNGADDWEELAYALGSELDESHAELTRLHKKEEYLTDLLSSDELWWTATCLADGKGKHSKEFHSLDALIEAVESGEVEIPEYSHDPHDELLLYGHCSCEEPEYE